MKETLTNVIFIKQFGCIERETSFEEKRISTKKRVFIKFHNNNTKQEQKKWYIKKKKKKKKFS